MKNHSVFNLRVFAVVQHVALLILTITFKKIIKKIAM